MVRAAVRIPILLFVLTFLSTLVAGTFLAGGNPLKNPADIFSGLMFSVPLLAILGVHEMGHFTAAKRHGVAVTVPYFLPLPPALPVVSIGFSYPYFHYLGLAQVGIGTLGAFIKIKSPLPHRNALMDIGAAGPIAGALVAIPVLFIGLAMSHVVRVAGLPQAGYRLGDSLMLKIATYLVFGDLPAGHDVMLHPVAFAGWIGLLVTALNLIPSGQLDGGHIAYALFGGLYERTARLVPFFLLLMGLLWPGWFLWAGLLFVLGTRHPRPVFDDVPLSRGRRLVGLASVILFLLCFTPNPISV